MCAVEWHSKVNFIRCFTVALVQELQKSTESSEGMSVPSKFKQNTVPDESSIMRKELDKSYAKITNLEERIQDLTLQTTGVCAFKSFHSVPDKVVSLHLLSWTGVAVGYCRVAHHAASLIVSSRIQILIVGVLLFSYEHDFPPPKNLELLNSATAPSFSCVNSPTLGSSLWVGLTNSHLHLH